MTHPQPFDRTQVVTGTADLDLEQSAGFRYSHAAAIPADRAPLLTDIELGTASIADFQRGISTTNGSGCQSANYNITVNKLEQHV